jgi:hypothetical protein
MPESKYEKYVVRKPIYEAGVGYQGRQSPTMTFMSSKQVPEANYYIELGWIYEIPRPNPHIHEHVHPYDEIVLHWGGNPEMPQVLGGEIEFYIGGQPITFNTTTGIYIPAGTPHGPLTWKKFEFPHIEMAFMLGTGDMAKGWDKSGITESKRAPSKKTKKFDYEQYVIRSPMRESPGALSGQGRQSPTMTYMSGLQIPGVNIYIEMGWIYAVTDTLDEMHHDNFDEIVLHIGGDPKDPEDLGADMTFGMGGDHLKFNKSYGVFIPKGMNHGPVIWHKFRKPHIEMAIMLGAPTLKEGWGFDARERFPHRSIFQRD